jgi:hypothetical protein
MGGHLRSFSLLLPLLAVAATAGCRRDAPTTESAPIGPRRFRDGDVLASKRAPVHVSKLLEVEALGDAGTAFHMMLFDGEFASAEAAKRAYASKSLRVAVMHAPMDGASYTPETHEVIGHEPVTPDEVEGYRAYREAVGAPAK